MSHSRQGTSSRGNVSMEAHRHGFAEGIMLEAHDIVSESGGYSLRAGLWPPEPEPHHGSRIELILTCDRLWKARLTTALAASEGSETPRTVGAGG